MSNIKYITYQNFYWWISQDDYLTQPNQVLYSTGLNLNSDTYSVKLEAWYTTDITTNDNDMYCWFYVEDSGWNRSVAAAWQDGEVYLYWGTNDTPDFTFADGWSVMNAINMGWYVYFIRASGTSQIKIWKMDENNTSITWVTETISTTGDTLPNATSKSIYPLYNYNDEYLIIWVWGTIITLDSSNVVTNYNIFSNAIISIEKIWSQFKICSTDGTVAFWAFWAAAISESFKINNYLRWAIDKDSLSFIISWFNTAQTNIHLSSWYSAPIIASKYNWDRLDVDKFKVSLDRPQQLTKVWNTVFFVNETSNIYDSLWSYWNNISSLWDSFQELFRINPNGTGKINSIYWFQWPSNNTVYLSITEGWVEKLAKYTERSSIEGTWYMILNTLDWGDRTRKKKMIWIYVTVSWCSADNPIVISASFDQWSYTTIGTITNEWDSERVEISTPTNTWQDVNFKITLTDWGAWQPVFHWMRVKYEIIED